MTGDKTGYVKQDVNHKKRKTRKKIGNSEHDRFIYFPCTDRKENLNFLGGISLLYTKL